MLTELQTAEKPWKSQQQLAVGLLKSLFLLDIVTPAAHSGGHSGLATTSQLTLLSGIALILLNPNFCTKYYLMTKIIKSTLLQVLPSIAAGWWSMNAAPQKRK